MYRKNTWTRTKGKYLSALAVFYAVSARDSGREVEEGRGKGVTGFIEFARELNSGTIVRVFSRIGPARISGQSCRYVFNAACTYAAFSGRLRRILPVASCRAAAIAGAASAFAASDPPP